MADRRQQTRDRRKPPGIFKRLDGWLEGLLNDPGDEKPSTLRAGLWFLMVAFVALAFADADFRDPGAFTSLMLTFVVGIVGPKVLDLRMAIGNAAAAIGRKWTRKEATVTTTETKQVADVEEVADVDRSDREQEA